MNQKRKSKKGILRNALVFLFSVVFTVSAYAAPVYDTRVAAEIIEQDTIAPTNEMLNGNAWCAIKPEKAIMLAFEDNFIGIYNRDEYGNASNLIGEYQLDGNKITISYLGYTDNGKLTVVKTPVYKTYYIGFTGDGSCIFSMNGIDYISLEQMPNE